MPDVSQCRTQGRAYRRGFGDGQQGAFKRACLEAYLSGFKKGRSNGYRAGYADGLEQACRATAERQDRRERQKP